MFASALYTNFFYILSGLNLLAQDELIPAKAQDSKKVEAIRRLFSLQLLPQAYRRALDLTLRC